MSPTIRLVRRTGTLAEDKDLARYLRGGVVLPALEDGSDLTIDFGGIEEATQSFVHALISEAVRTHGDRALRHIAFRRCSPSVQEVITTVVTYSLELATDSAQSQIRSTDIPQADVLPTVRRVVLAVARGATTADRVALRLTISPRHAQYRLTAARILGLIRDSRKARITATGSELLRTRPFSIAEQEVFRCGFEQSDVFRRVVPDILQRTGPSRHAITGRLVRTTTLRRSTAYRRAGALLAWRRYLIQLPLFGEGRHES